MGSRNSRAQTLIRMLGYWEYKFGLRFSPSHVAGVDNVRADLGSRLAGHDLRGPPALRNDLATYLRAHSVAPSTFTKYETAFQHWSEWCRQRGFDTFLLGPNPSQQIEVISGYVIHGFCHGFGSGHSIKSSSIAVALQGVKHFFQASGQQFLGSYAQLRMLLKGVGHFDIPKRSKAPVSIALMESVFHSLRLNRPEDQALWGILCISLFFLLRRSEITASHKSEFQWFALRAEDLVIVDSQGDLTSIPELASTVYLKLRGSKTNQSGPPTVRMLKRSGHPALCPVAGALLLHQARRSVSTKLPVAIYSDSSGADECVTERHVASAIQAAAARMGEDPRDFSSHSLRAGGATLMYCNRAFPSYSARYTE